MVPHLTAILRCPVDSLANLDLGERHHVDEVLRILPDQIKIVGLHAIDLAAGQIVSRSVDHRRQCASGRSAFDFVHPVRYAVRANPDYPVISVAALV